MDWKQLVIFSENCSRLLNCGLLHKEAVGKAAEVLTSRLFRRFAEGLLECRVELRSIFASPILDFYGSLVRLGLETGRLAESLLVGAGYMQELMPVQEVVDRCRWLSVLALLIFATVSLIYVGFGSALQLLLLLGVLVLPLLLRPLRFVLDLFYSAIPFVGTWSQQLALMEFFSAMSICYDSRMHVDEMYSRSADSISNLYLRKQVRGVVNCAPDGAGFAQTLGSIGFISRGMKSALHVHEYSGKLAYCFDEFAVELRKLVIAKLEIVKAVSVAIVISVGICMPLMIILPRVIDFISSDILLLGIGAVNGYIWFGSIKLAVSRYLKKSSEINTWWQGN